MTLLARDVAKAARIDPLDWLRAPADPLAALRARAEARALLVAIGFLEMQAAVDQLQADAERDGLVDAIGQDAVQQIMSAAFEAART